MDQLDETIAAHDRAKPVIHTIKSHYLHNSGPPHCVTTETNLVQKSGYILKHKRRISL